MPCGGERRVPAGPLPLVDPVARWAGRPESGLWVTWLGLAALPPLDAVILSHNHYDHLDRSTVRALTKTGVPFITALGAGAHLEKRGVPPTRITELD